MRPALRTLASLVGAGLIAGAAALAASPAPPSIALEGTVLRATLADGTSLAGGQLAGRELLIPADDGPVVLRIEAVRQDPATPELLLYDIRTPAGADGWNNICEPDAQGGRWAIPLAGAMTDDGRFEPDLRRLTMTCTSGVVGKCLRAGYRFWTAGGGVDAQALQRFQACTRLYRADYCGDGRSWTADGTLIDVYDDAGVQAPEPVSALAFEAGWSPAGAVCVHHTRVPRNIGLDDLLRRCPRLGAAGSGEACTEDRARRGGAILFNKSGMRP